MQQKVALTTAHFPVRGRIADMGSGSGRGTYDLASLYDGLELIGVDINPVSVELSNEKFKRPNLSYCVGDISQMVFPENSLDGILDSSVLHHVTSFNDFDVKRVLQTFDNQVAQLKPGGVIIIRDFVIPDGPEQVYLDLPETDGVSSGNYKELSTAAVFEIFATTWRGSVNPDGPLGFVRTQSPRQGFVRIAREHANRDGMIAIDEATPDEVSVARNDVDQSARGLGQLAVAERISENPRMPRADARRDVGAQTVRADPARHAAARTRIDARPVSRSPDGKGSH